MIRLVTLLISAIALKTVKSMHDIRCKVMRRKVEDTIKIKLK